MAITIEKLKAIFQTKGYIWNENVNIIGVRTSDKVDVFDDTIILSYKKDGIWIIKEYKATTESGLYYLQNPMNPSGTKILKEGQYLKVFAIGLHQGKYIALKQVGKMTYHLDNNRDANFDFTSKLYVGIIGSNIHHAGVNSTIVGRWSGACQVLAIMAEWNEFIGICQTLFKLYGNFDYTLINKKDLI